MTTVYVTLRGEQKGVDGWKYARAILEAAEPGAGKHCVLIESNDHVTSYTHLRLQIRVSIVRPLD